MEKKLKDELLASLPDKWPEDVMPADHVEQHDGLPVAIAEGSVDDLRGAVLDLSSTGPAAGLVIRNPNTPSPGLGLGDDIELTTYRDMVVRFGHQPETIEKGRLAEIARAVLEDGEVVIAPDHSPAETFAALASALAAVNVRPGPATLA